MTVKQDTTNFVKASPSLQSHRLVRLTLCVQCSCSIFTLASLKSVHL